MARRRAVVIQGAEPSEPFASIRAVPDISVSDLAIAAGMNDTAVSQALRLLRLAEAVAAGKDGRVMRYRITDETILALLPVPRAAAVP